MNDIVDLQVQYTFQKIGTVSFSFSMYMENNNLTVDKGKVKWNTDAYTKDENIMISSFVCTDDFDDLVLNYLNGRVRQ